jgi:nitrite reductase (NADH) small subunit
MSHLEKRSIPVCPAAELLPGERRIIDAGGGRSIGVFNVKGKYYALRNLCPHAGAELCRGVVTGMNEASGVGEFHWVRDGEILRCPWHGWEFDILTGRSVFCPDKVRVATYETAVESFDVAVDDGMVVVRV